eukprot:2860513-Rhodomonas_salina.1
MHPGAGSRQQAASAKVEKREKASQEGRPGERGWSREGGMRGPMEKVAREETSDNSPDDRASVKADAD